MRVCKGEEERKTSWVASAPVVSSALKSNLFMPQTVSTAATTDAASSADANCSKFGSSASP